MSDMPGTVQEREPVADTVAEELDSMDPDTLRSALAEERETRKRLESQIGRQNNVHGQRMQTLEQRLEAVLVEQQTRDQEREQAIIAARLAAMSPAQQAIEIARQTQAQIKQMEAKEQQTRAQAQERALIEGVLVDAKRLRIDPEEIDQSSPTNALMSFYEAKDRQTQERIKRLESKLEQDKEETAEEIARAQGRTLVTTGGPGALPRTKMSPQEKDLRERFVKARAKGTRGGDEIMDLRIEAQRLGIALT